MEDQPRQQMMNQRWTPLQCDTIRISTDAAMSAKKVRTGLGIVARNWNGELVEVRAVQELKKGCSNQTGSANGKRCRMGEN